VDGLRRDVRRLRQQVEKFQRAYQKRAEAQSRASGAPDEASQRAFRRLKQLQLAISHVESSAAYLGGAGIEPARDDDQEQIGSVAMRVLESLEAERERLYRDVHDGPAQVLANAIFEVARGEGSLETVENELFQFSQLFQDNEQLREKLTDQSLPVEKRQAIVEDLLGQKATPLTVNLISFIVGAGRARELSFCGRVRASESWIARSQHANFRDLASPQQPVFQGTRSRIPRHRRDTSADVEHRPWTRGASGGDQPTDRRGVAVHGHRGADRARGTRRRRSAGRARNDQETQSGRLTRHQRRRRGERP